VSEPAYRSYAEGSEIDALKVQLVYKKKKQEGLWWWANCVAGISTKATIRHWHTRRLRKGLEDALKERGYASDGLRLEKDDGKEALTGSLQLLGTVKVADPKWATVREECAKVLDQVIYLHSKPALSTEGSQRSQRKTQKRSQGDGKEKGVRRLQL
jgi:hypothetical protein